MTDLKHDLERLMVDEPAGPDDLSPVIVAGRRALRRRTIVTSAAGTAGVAAVTAAVVVPTVVIGSSGGQGTSTINVRSDPTSRPCHTAFLLAPSGQRSNQADIRRAVKQMQRKTAGRIYQFRTGYHQRVIGLSTCSKSGRAQTTPMPAPTPTSTPSPTSPPLPRYHYTEHPSHISARLGAHLADRLHTWNFTIVYSRPFAQETSQLGNGHPTYYDGNDDVRINGQLADVGVQVTHRVTSQVPFTGSCKPPSCEQTTLPDGSVERTSRIHAGSGGAMVISVEVRHPNGLDVMAQMSNYAFGPEATRARSDHQPLTSVQLESLATDPKFSF